MVLTLTGLKEKVVMSKAAGVLVCVHLNTWSEWSHDNTVAYTCTRGVKGCDRAESTAAL